MTPRASLLCLQVYCSPLTPGREKQRTSRWLAFLTQPIAKDRREAGTTPDHNLLTVLLPAWVGVWGRISLTSYYFPLLYNGPEKSLCKELEASWATGDRGCYLCSYLQRCPSSVYDLWTLEMVRSWVTSLLPGGYQPRARSGGREMGMEGDYGLSFPYSNGADKMSLKAWSTCFEGKGHIATIPFKESLTGQVCLVINVSWQWLERYTGRCHRAAAMLTLGEPSRPAYVGRLSKACTGACGAHC